MSGGVDSSVAAHLLQEDGWKVIGVTFEMGTTPETAPADSGRASGPQDALNVCRKLGIPHHTIDCRDEFRKRVVEPFCDEYFRGRTPNPCVRCNPMIKFAQLIRTADDLGAEAVSTGHYAIVELGGLSAGGRVLLRKSPYAPKEQSYVLHQLRQEQLARCRFPLGTWEKPKVRSLAAELGFRTHNRPDSQEICFIPDNDYGAFLARFTPQRIRPGRIVDTSGKYLGRHRGIHLFTLGQRRRLGVAVGEPRYVVRIESDTATVVIGPKDQTFRSGFIVREVNWIALENPTTPLEAEVKIRYTHRPAAARIEPLPAERAARVTFHSPESAITPGQAAVFYRDDLVLGGGTIDEVENG